VADHSHLFAFWEGISGKELPNLLLESLPTHPSLLLILVGVREREIKQNWHSSFNKLIMSAFRPELAQDQGLLLGIPQREDRPQLRLSIVQEPGEIEMKAFTSSIARLVLLDQFVNISW